MDYQVVTSDELPLWYTKERYIHSGYRRCNTFKACACSLFKVHNQSLNIWLHLPISFLLIPYMYYVMNQNKYPLTLNTDTIILYISVIFGNVTTLMVSGLCHTFYCMSRKIHNICWFVDFVGLLTGILGGGIGIGYFSFKCVPPLLYSYLAIMAVTYPIAISVTWKKYKAHIGTLPLVPDYSFPEFIGSLTLFTLLSWIMVLAIDKLYLVEYTDNEDFKVAWNLSAICPVLLTLGALIQSKHFPEKYLKPGTVDIIGSSHQLWHVCCTLIMGIWIHAITTHYNARMNMQCVC